MRRRRAAAASRAAARSCRDHASAGQSRIAGVLCAGVVVGFLQPGSDTPAQALTPPQWTAATAVRRDT